MISAILSDFLRFCGFSKKKELGIWDNIGLGGKRSDI